MDLLSSFQMIHIICRRTLIELIFVLLFGLNVAMADDRPNIVFILADDLRWDALGSTGHNLPKDFQTPNIDRIAKEGVIFRNAYVTDPLCFPSRASILSGQYAHTNGVKVASDRARLGHRLVTFPLLLHGAGYETALIGKWHLANEAVPAPGIDRWVSFKEQGIYVDPELYIDGHSEKMKGYLTDILTDYAVDFIQKPHTKPFMLYLAHKAPHAPWIPPERYKNRFYDAPIIPPPGAFDTWEGKPVLKRAGIKLEPKSDTDIEITHFNVRDYLSCVLAIDDGVKRIFDVLEATGQLDKTIIVFTSDNGYFWGEHDLGGKHGPYEEAIRVPLLVRYPKLIQTGSVIDQFALNIDFAPTLLALAGVHPPENMEGRSLLPLFKGDARSWRSSFLTEFFLGDGTNRFPTWQAVHTDRWKYIRYVGMEQFNELYDLQADPFELNNLVNDPHAQEERAIMEKELSSLLNKSK
jgi:N-acetylglucosamine-6-sulfatase